jgi:hypothetical protein
LPEAQSFLPPENAQAGVQNVHPMCYTEDALDSWLQGIQLIEILSLLPTLSFPPLSTAKI